MYLSHIFPRPSLVALLFLSASNTDTSTRFDFPAFLPYDYDSPRRASLRALRIAFWKYLSLIRGWLPPWKQQLLPISRRRLTRSPFVTLCGFSAPSPSAASASSGNAK